MPLQVTTTSLPAAFVGKSYSASLQASGGVQPYTWSLQYGGALPDGLSLDPASGDITGTPTNANGWAFTAVVTDETGAQATANLWILVNQVALISDVNLLSQNVTSQAIGIALSTNAIRLDWPVQGQPTGGVSDDLCYLRCLEEDDPVNRPRHIFRERLDQATVSVRKSYTRVWGIHWTFYGPNSYDRARQVRDAIYDSAARTLFAGLNLYPIPDNAAPQRAPETFPGGQWRERVDFSAAFSELVILVEAIQSVGEVEVVINNGEVEPSQSSPGVQKDFIARPGFAEGGFGEEDFGTENYGS